MQLRNWKAGLLAAAISAVCFVGCNSSSGPPEYGDAGTLYLEAQKAKNAGDMDRALELLNQSIASNPLSWAYGERALIHAKAARDEEATADVEAGLAMEPQNDILLWFERGTRQTRKSPQARSTAFIYEIGWDRKGLNFINPSCRLANARGRQDGI